MTSRYFKTRTVLRVLSANRTVCLGPVLSTPQMIYCFKVKMKSANSLTLSSIQYFSNDLIFLFIFVCHMLNSLSHIKDKINIKMSSMITGIQYKLLENHD